MHTDLPSVPPRPYTVNARASKAATNMVASKMIDYLYTCAVDDEHGTLEKVRW
jgi:hypothetical protein